MQIDKPLVSILLAVYKPNEKWLIEQLISLNEQSYNNLELIVYDDCPEHPVNEELFTDNITNFSFKIIRGIENKGSNIAFEELTRVGNGEYFAYCDQDDIWEKDKIKLMIDKFKNTDVTLVCSDLSIIDENSKKTADSITQIRKRHVFKSGYNLAKDLLMSNFVTGCAMIVRKDIAKKAVPFEKTLIHDQWIAIVGALEGKIEFINKPLVGYRQHSNNQTGILKGIYNKETYYNIKIVELLQRYESVRSRLYYDKEIEKYIEYCIKSLKIRKRYFKKPTLKDLKEMLRYNDYYKLSILLEMFSPIIPEFIFKKIIQLAQKGVL